MLLSDYDRVRIINLPERADRRREMNKQLKIAGLTGPNVAYFPAVRPDTPGMFTSRGMHGSFLSHKGVLEEAAAANESVLILEDDCNFLPEANGYEIPPCDIFYGSHDGDADMIIGAHCMGFTAETVKKVSAYLADYTKPDFATDPTASKEVGYDPNIRPPIDGAYVWFRRAHPELETRFAFLTYQRASRSDCTPAGTLDRIPVIRDIVEFGRRVREAIT